MISSFSPVRSDIVESRFRYIKLNGNGTAAPTIVHGTGVTIARAGAGDYKITFDENPGIYIGPPMCGFEDATESGMAGFSIVWNTFVAYTSSVSAVAELILYNASQVATDLTTAMYLSIYMPFKVSNLG